MYTELYYTEEESAKDIQLYLEHYGEDYPQLYWQEREGLWYKVIYNAPWPIPRAGDFDRRLSI